MSNPICCPKCKSEQFTAQKRGFSGGKAAVGIVLTGGVGTLAGLHGSDKVDVHCLSCGHKWDPVKQSQQANIKRIRREEIRTNRWKKQFYKAYESDNLEMADSIVNKHMRKLVERKGLDGAYRTLKNQDSISMIVQLIFVALFAWFLIWLVS